jgi:ubiquinone/menaquinone biosynthesis C-methylase UbiE
VAVDPVHEAYTSRASEYIEVVGKIEHAEPVDRDYLLAWARSIDGRLIDVGSGPGQWTNFFRDAGVDVEGVEPVEAFLDHARDRYPLAQFRPGRAEALGVPDGSIGGVLAWFSLIHTHPDLIDQPLNEFARCIRPGGSVALGFFEGAAAEPFDHSITTAYYWSVEALTERLEQAGFTVIDWRTRQGRGIRNQGVIVAVRNAT